MELLIGRHAINVVSACPMRFDNEWNRIRLINDLTSERSAE